VVAPNLSYNLAIWRDLWTDGGAIALHAHRFTTAMIEAAQARPSSGRRR
jgi:D-psicose/D-tagatose/L-ribulose 3-epimerase